MKLVVRVDADETIGAGHVMRSIALAQAWQDDGGEVVFVLNDAPLSIIDRISSEGIEIVRAAKPSGGAEDRERLLETMTKVGAEWCVIDGYGFDAEFCQSLREEGKKVLYIDDVAHHDLYSADILLNQNIGAEEFSYSVEGKHEKLLGTEYALLRRDLRNMSRPAVDTDADFKKVLVTVGGTDVHGLSEKIVSILAGANNDLEIRVMAGLANDRLQALKDAINRIDNAELVSDANSIFSQMEWADIAISGAGSTCWEMAYLVLPSLLIVCAENQRRIATKLEERGCSINLGWYTDDFGVELIDGLRLLKDNPTKFAAMREASKALVDGRGAERVIAKIKIAA